MNAEDLLRAYVKAAQSRPADEARRDRTYHARTRVTYTLGDAVKADQSRKGNVK